MSDPIVQIALQIDGKKRRSRQERPAQGCATDWCRYPDAMPPREAEDYGGCRLCLVEVESRGRTNYVASCLYPVEQGPGRAHAFGEGR